MKSIKIFLAALMIMLASNFLSGCSSQAPEPVDVSGTPQASVDLSQLAMARMDQARELEKTIHLDAQVLSESEDQLHVVLQLLNPEQKPLTSVESWLSYSPDQLEGVRMRMNDAIFELPAPYQNGFDPASGLLRLGQSTHTPVTDEQIVLAELWFEKKQSGPVMVEAYDYQYDLSGHQSANVMYEGVPVNMLLKPASPLLVLQ